MCVLLQIVPRVMNLLLAVFAFLFYFLIFACVFGMPVKHVNSDYAFNSEMTKAGTKPVCVDFFAEWYDDFWPYFVDYRLFLVSDDRNLCLL